MFKELLYPHFYEVRNKNKDEGKFKQIWQCAKTRLGPDRPTMKTTTASSKVPLHTWKQEETRVV